MYINKLAKSILKSALLCIMEEILLNNNIPPNILNAENLVEKFVAYVNPKYPTQSVF